jgi:hypothetical protein
MLLARTVSNIKGAVLLLDAHRIVEARTITRCCLENLYWTVGLAEEGESFARKMRDDDFAKARVKPLALARFTVMHTSLSLDIYDSLSPLA